MSLDDDDVAWSCLGCEALFWGTVGYVALCKWLLDDWWWIAAIAGVALAIVAWVINALRGGAPSRDSRRRR